MICDGCICMNCKDWESCPYYARCEVTEMASCGQRKDCRYYSPEKNNSKNNKQKGQMNYEVV